MKSTRCKYLDDRLASGRIRSNTSPSSRSRPLNKSNVSHVVPSAILRKVWGDFLAFPITPPRESKPIISTTSVKGRASAPSCQNSLRRMPFPSTPIDQFQAAPPSIAISSPNEAIIENATTFFGIAVSDTMGTPNIAPINMPFANGMLIGAILGVPIVSETAMPKNVVAFSMIASFGLLMAMLGGAAWNWSIGVDGNGIRRSEFWQLGADARPLTDVVEIIGFDSRGGVIGNARKSPHTFLRMADGTTWDTFDLLSGRERELGDVLERILPEARRSSKYLHRVDFMGRTIDVVDTLP